MFNSFNSTHRYKELTVIFSCLEGVQKHHKSLLESQPKDKARISRRLRLFSPLFLSYFGLMLDVLRVFRAFQLRMQHTECTSFHVHHSLLQLLDILRGMEQAPAFFELWCLNSLKVPRREEAVSILRKLYENTAALVDSHCQGVVLSAIRVLDLKQLSCSYGAAVAIATRIQVQLETNWDAVVDVVATLPGTDEDKWLAIAQGKTNMQGVDQVYQFALTVMSSSVFLEVYFGTVVHTDRKERPKTYLDTLNSRCGTCNKKPY
eukprot:TRINITY_DN7080_c0_g2_i1.p1 TRINITY_DN7080_c0_g2~~TRINITY_DN7080_c0_g2_i1.p1  ORF type:complete len:262 (+),score=42.22 TRINITY_DN7080_c0_g2_i1:377-1162(+)